MYLNKLVISAALAVVSVSTLASAHVKDVVVDHKGKHVISTNGNCVRTKWMRESDVCGVSEVKNPTWVFFDFDKSNIRPSEVSKLNKVADHINLHGIQSVSIYGHADRLGSSEYNKKLSERRANSVLAFLKGKTDVADMKVDMKAFGKDRQVKACEGASEGDVKSCLQPNRRVEVLMKE